VLTTFLVVAASVLGTLAVVLLVVLVRSARARPHPAEQPAPAPEPQPQPAPPAATHDLDGLTRDLHEVVARYREPPKTASPPRAPSRAAGPADNQTSAVELEELLAQALETASAIPGADAALVSVTAAGGPVIGTLGLARPEAERLAATLPSAGSRTRSIAIGYEYEDDARLDVPAGRIERGIAVPVPGVATPALLAILTRTPGANLGEPQVALLEEVARRVAPALAAVVDAQATTTPVSITVRELDRGGTPRREPEGSAEGQERHEGRQIDWLRRG
jgi:hypothetical protein